MYKYPITMSKNNTPYIKVKDKFIGLIKTINAFGDEVNNLHDLNELLTGKRKGCHHHPLTGPIVFENAKAGDYLKVVIKDIKINKMAQCLSKSAGVKPIIVEHFGNRSAIFSKYDSKNYDISYCHGRHIPYKPMLGIIGTAMNEDIKTGHAGKFGGNLDIPFVTRNATVYIPVCVDGGYLYLGDAHANQAYGELGGIALEASATVDIDVSILKPINKQMDSIIVLGKEPFSEKNALGIVGIGDNIDDINTAIQNSFVNSVKVLNTIYPEFNESTISNFLTIIGHSFLGQAYSKTAESTAIINILETDLKCISNNPNFNIYELEGILFE